MAECFMVTGDNRHTLRTLHDNSVDAIVTDPPYGLGKEPNMTEVLEHWMRGDDFTASGGGFMGKTWDSFVPGPATWEEVYRVLKPGGHILMFSGTRTFDIATLALRLAGFEIRDTLSWMYGQGFPKSMDISKAIDKQAGTATPEAQQWEGWGTALKPAWEPIVVARKPVEGTVAANVLKYGTGALNIDATRIGTSKDVPASVSNHVARDVGVYEGNRDGSGGGETNEMSGHNPNIGRFPANTLLTHTEDCVQVGTRDVKSGVAVKRNLPPEGADQQINFKARSFQKDDETYAGPDGMETIEAWECADDCPIRLLDEQTGVRKSSGEYEGDGSRRSGGRGVTNFEQADDRHRPNVMYSDQGGASRFFYNGKVTKKERNLGLPEWTKLTCPECNSETDKLGGWIDHRKDPPDPPPPEGTDGMSQPRGTSEGELMDEWSSPTSSPGSSTTDLSQPDTKSTTSMETSSTTTSTTFNSSPSSNTNGSTADASFEMESGGSRVEDVESSSPSTSSTGTSAQKGGPSTEDADPATSESSLTPSVCAVCGHEGVMLSGVVKMVNDHPT